MIKHTVLFAALALAAVPACKKKDADAPAPAPAPTPEAPKPSDPAAKPVEAMKPPEPPKVKTGKELADQYVACSADLPTKTDAFMTDCVDANYVGHNAGHDGKDVKPADLKAHFDTMHAAFSDMKAAPQLILVNGRNVFAVSLVTGTNDGTMKMPGMPDMPATNKKIGFLMAHKLTFNDANKVSEEWSFSDPATVMFQLGVAPKDAPPHRAAMDKGLDGAPVIAVAADDAKEKANLDLVKKSDDAFNAHKTADVLATMTDDAVESDLADPNDATGKKDIEKGMKMFIGAFSDAKVTGDHFAAGDYVVDIGNFEGTNDHDMGKMKKTGKHVSVPFMEISQVKDGKINHLWRFYSSMEFAKQLGMLPAGGHMDAPKADGDKKPDAKKPDGAKK